MKKSLMAIILATLMLTACSSEEKTEKDEMLKTLIKENKRLKYENEKLRKFLDDTKEDRAKYRQLADDMKVLKKKYCHIMITTSECTRGMHVVDDINLS